MIFQIVQFLHYFEILCEMFREKPENSQSIFKRRNTFPPNSAPIFGTKPIQHDRDTSKAPVRFGFVLMLFLVNFHTRLTLSRSLTFYWNFVRKAQFIASRILSIARDTGLNGTKYDLHFEKSN